MPTVRPPNNSKMSPTSLSFGVVFSLLIALFCFVFVASGEDGLSIAVQDESINDLGYLERPTSVIEKLDLNYGWAIAIEREQIESVRVHFAMSDFESQTLAGIGRPNTIEQAEQLAPRETIAELQALVAQERAANEVDSSSMPVVELFSEDGSVVFASPRVLMRHCPLVNATADLFRDEGVYVVLEEC